MVVQIQRPGNAIDREAWERYIGRRSSCPWEMMEGDKPDITGVTLIEFPTMEAARAWHNDPEYQPYIKAIWRLLALC